MTCRPLPNFLFIRQMHAAEYSLEELMLSYCLSTVNVDGIWLDRHAKRLTKQAIKVDTKKKPKKKLDSDGEDGSDESSMEGRVLIGRLLSQVINICVIFIKNYI